MYGAATKPSEGDMLLTLADVNFPLARLAYLPPNDVVQLTFPFRVFLGGLHAGCRSVEIVLGEDALAVFVASKHNRRYVKIAAISRHEVQGQEELP